MFAQELKKNQKIAYRILYNALKRNSLAHAYLFTGEEGTPKLECAYYLVQSLLCENDIMACEVCDDCRHVATHGYADLIYLDGNKTTIKKKDILDIQERFSKTKLELKGKKVYILDGVENSTKEAMNALLKFLEEPESDTLAILISTNTDRLLETIVSRCQNIPFYKNDEKVLEEELLKEMDCTNAHILSAISANKKQAMEIYEKDEFQHAYYLFKEFLKQDSHSAKVFLQQEGFSKSKRNAKEVFSYFLNIMIFLCKDALVDRNIESWQESMTYIKKFNLEKILSICVNTKDKIVKSVNIQLLVDQFLYEWEEK